MGKRPPTKERDFSRLCLTYVYRVACSIFNVLHFPKIPKQSDFRWVTTNKVIHQSPVRVRGCFDNGAIGHSGCLCVLRKLRGHLDRMPFSQGLMCIFFPSHSWGCEKHPVLAGKVKDVERSWASCDGVGHSPPAHLCPEPQPAASTCGLHSSWSKSVYLAAILRYLGWLVCPADSFKICFQAYQSILKYNFYGTSFLRTRWMFLIL